MAKSASDLVSLGEHVELHAARTKLVVFEHWHNAENALLSTEVVRGCEE